MVRGERHRTARARRFNGRYPVVRRQADRSHTSPRLVRRTLPAPRPREIRHRGGTLTLKPDADGARAPGAWARLPPRLRLRTVLPPVFGTTRRMLRDTKERKGRRPDRQHRGASNCATVFTLKVHMRRRTFISSSAAAEEIKVLRRICTFNVNTVAQLLAPRC